MSTTLLPQDQTIAPTVISGLFAGKLSVMALGLFGTTGKRIRLLRDSKDMNQKDLQGALRGHGIEVGTSFLSQLESSKKYPSLEMVVALARVLGTTTDFLLMLTDDPSPATTTDSQIVIDVQDRAERALLEDWMELMKDIEPERRETVLRSVRLLLSPAKAPAPRIVE